MGEKALLKESKKAQRLWTKSFVLLFLIDTQVPSCFDYIDFHYIILQKCLSHWNANVCFRMKLAQIMCKIIVRLYWKHCLNYSHGHTHKTDFCRIIDLSHLFKHKSNEIIYRVRGKSLKRQRNKMKGKREDYVPWYCEWSP